MNGTNMASQGHANGAPRVRLPTVDEALPYTPLSSIVPFGSDIIPFPLAGPPPCSSIFPNQSERDGARRSLASLNEEAVNLPTSLRLQRTLQDLQSLLRSEDLTELQFKKPSYFSEQPTFNQNTNNYKMPRAKLTPVAELVLGKTDISFGYPSPISPDRKKPTSKPAPSPKQLRTQAHAYAQPLVEIPVQSSNRNTTTLKKNAQSPRSPPKKTPIKVISTTPKQQTVGNVINVSPVPPIGDVIAVVPKAFTSPERAQFVSVSPPQFIKEAQAAQKRRRSATADDLALDVDQRQKAEAALEALESQLTDIFEAEDHLIQDTSGAISVGAANFFVSGADDEKDIPVLSPAIHVKVEQAIRKLVDAGFFSRVEVDRLTRIQKLCEGAISGVDSLSLLVSEGWGDSDVEEWARRVDIAENGLQAAKVLLRIMSAGREEKQLYSQDMVQSILNAEKHVFDMCIVPVIEARSSSDAFSTLTSQKKKLSTFLQVASRVLRLLGDLITKVEVAEDAITTVEFLCFRLIFVENAHIEKDSALGIQRIEGVRRVAMDVLAQIFARYSDQRNFIFDEILTSLEKLPVTRQSARQFKLLDGKPIQLVSALLMRLVQTSATKTIRKVRGGLDRAMALDEDESGDESASETSSPKKTIANGRQKFQAEDDTQVSGDTLPELSKPLYDSALANAQYVVKFMVQRAMTSTKSGDQPYRNLLDIFTEDFLNVLGNTDWPAAELLLRALLTNMVGLMEGDKSSAPAKTMALDLMGVMGSGISDLRIHVRHCRASSSDQTSLPSLLVQLADDTKEDKAHELDLLNFEGPYRMVLDYLRARDFKMQDPQLQSAQGYYLTQWAKQLCTELEEGNDDFAPKLPGMLASMINNPRWLETNYATGSASTAGGRFASAIITLNLPFCKAFRRIFTILLNSMNSDQATVKSRSIKSVVQLLEKDPEILDTDKYIVAHILRPTVDQSPMVRDSALQLLGKCLQLRPSLENDVCEKIVLRANDASIGVRKRAMKILKEIYLRNQSQEIKAAIADALLQRVKDADESVADIARQTFEEIWIAPFQSVVSGKDDAVKSKLALQKHMFLIVRTAQRGDAVLSVLEPLLTGLLSNDAKNNVLNFRICKAMVATMFDAVIDNSGNSREDMPKQQHILQTLTVFAKANPKLFDGEQLELLEPYVKNLSTTDDLLIYRSVVVIFRYVMPSLASFQHTFLKAVQDALLTTLSRLGKMELNEVASCLWTIDSVLKNTDRLNRLIISVLKQLHAIKEQKVDFNVEANDKILNKLKRFIVIAGYVGKACDFEPQIEVFKADLPWWKGTSGVAGLIVDLICPFTSQKQPMSLRETALESVCIMCQAWPRQYVRKDVIQALDLVFINENTKLEHIILAGFHAFLAQEEKRSESGAAISVGEGAVHGAERLGSSLVSNDNDSATTQLAQKFLHHVLRIALATTGDLALAATQVIASINRQGLVHPKECGPSLVALETSTNSVIANIAFQEHRSLYGKHESLFEKEHMKAVHQAYEYQKDVIGDPLGATTNPIQAKLKPFWEVMKTGGAKPRKKFLAHLCQKLDFELPKFQVEHEGQPPLQLWYARFCVENLALFDYTRVDELLHLLTTMEKIVTTTGATVAHAIDIDILKNGVAQPPLTVIQLQPGQAIPVQPIQDVIQAPQEVSPPDPERLRQLSMASLILSIIWETRGFLRRLWGLQKQNSKGKPSIKDLNRAPTRAQFVSTEKFLDTIAAITAAHEMQEAQVATCRAFAELMAVDHEVKVDEDEMEGVNATNGYETPDEDGGDDAPGTPGSRGRKRKGSASAHVTPSNRKRKRASSKSRKPAKKAKSGSTGSPDAEGEWE